MGVWVFCCREPRLPLFLVLCVECACVAQVRKFHTEEAVKIRDHFLVLATVDPTLKAGGQRLGGAPRITPRHRPRPPKAGGQSLRGAGRRE